MTGVEVAATGDATGAFADVVDPFARLVALQHAGGAACTIVHRGRVVVDVAAGGHRLGDRQLLFSITKLATATVVWIAHERGLLDVDEPLAACWPALDRSSTAAITPRMVLAHRSGLASLDDELSLDDLAAGADDDAVGAQEPYWAPDATHGYHAFTFGTLLRGLVRRRLQASVRELVADWLAGPLGIDLAIGTDDAAAVLRHERAPGAARTLPTAATRVPPSTTARLQARDPGVLADPRFIALELPGTNGVGSARGVALLLDALSRPGLLRAGTLEAMTALRSSGRDAALGFDTAFGTGVQRPFPRLPMLGPASFGHEAAGGSVAFADPRRGLAVAITTTAQPSVAGAGTTPLALVPTILACADRAAGTPQEAP